MTVAISFTAGWCDRKTFDLLQKCIESTKQIPDREILLCTDVQSLPFESDARILHRPKATLSAKNNILFQEAKNDIIVYIRDYMLLTPNWFEGMEKFGWDWDMCMTRVVNKDGSRFRDWCVWDHPDFGHPWTQSDKPWPQGIQRRGRPGLVPYDFSDTSGHYISGAYFLGKRQFLLDNPFDERLDFGQAEDIEFSDRVKYKWNYKMNINSVVQLQIQKDRILQEYK